MKGIGSRIKLWYRLLIATNYLFSLVFFVKIILTIVLAENIMAS